MLIMKRKFDIRIWVVIPSWNPLRIYVYKDCYLRFSCNDYDPRQPSNLFSHLTNNSISKKLLSRPDNYKTLNKIPGNMWHLSDLRAHLNKKKAETEMKLQKENQNEDNQQEALNGNVEVEGKDDEIEDGEVDLNDRDQQSDQGDE